MHVPTSLDLLEGELTITNTNGEICGTFTHQNDESKIINSIETIHENKYNITGSIKDKDQWEVIHDVSKDIPKPSSDGKRSKFLSFASNSSAKKSLSRSNLSLASINSMQNKIQIPVKTKA